MIEITKIEPINNITLTLVCPRLSHLRYPSSFMIIYHLKTFTNIFSNLVNASDIASNGAYVLGCIQSTCIIAKVRSVNQ